MPGQEFELLDYLAPIVVAVLFALITFLISFFIINYFCITEDDDLTRFEDFGLRQGFQLGSRSPNTIRNVYRNQRKLRG
ncbi:hypothetical protein AB6A40_008885 [Gnathostoma spinigerum]|uniref:Uncharacterized protein n=1 Tax=Gnathostoma spinigerum TaxID=75299 RepID=A0ABD6EQQ5_9BILA